MNISSDDRRLAYFDLFPQTPGQVNVVHLHPGALCAWHRHQKQTDHYFCVSGTVKVGIFGPDWEGKFFVLDARNPAILTVPPNHWHGYQCIGDSATMIQYLDQKYDAEDEERSPVDIHDWETVPR